MPSLELAAGSLRVTYPDSYGVAPERPASARGEGREASSSAWSGPVGPSDEVSAALLDAFAAQGLELVAPFELEPTTPAGPSEGRSQRPSRPGKVRIALDLPQDQDAVILLEQDGLLSWQPPTAHDSAPTPSPSRSGPQTAQALPAAESRMQPATRVVRFEIDVRPVATARPRVSAAAHTARGPFGGFVIGRVKAYVLRFDSRIVPGAMLSFLERRTHPGLVLMTGSDVKRWPLVDNLAQVTLPNSRPAKILLFVHGTFSTTVGSFGILTATAQGQQFLEAAASSYDAILGFDHQTLSRDPLENAIDLYTRLEGGKLAFTPTIDIVSYSRGSLVARSLIEYLLPSSPWTPDIGKVVFVGGTNAGTALAEPENWRIFADLYTNLAAATARSIGFATKTAPAAEIVGGLVAGIGTFVRYLASESAAAPALPGRSMPSRSMPSRSMTSVSMPSLFIPGLAAMEPDGAFVTGINGTQPGQPVAGTPWHVVSSDFEVKLFDDRHEPAELPRVLVAKLADGLVDRLLDAKNDLVVDTASMSSVDLPSGGGFIKETLSFGTNGVVHHLNYFIQPRVCDSLRNWLT